MKHVFSDPSSVAHLWAAQSQDDARTSGNGNFYFSGKTIYSYGSHFPIAKHVVNKKGIKAILFTELVYSSDTSKHISYTRGACSNDLIIYCYRPDSSERENFDYWQKQIEGQADKLVRARKPELYLNAIESISSTANKYADYWKIKIPKTLQLAMNITNKEVFADYAAKKDKQIIADKIKREREFKKKLAESLKKWNNHETNYLNARDGRDYLRVGQNRIETSQNVQIAFTAGRVFFEALRSGTIKVGDELSGYTVREVGDIVRIGCHTFPMSYLLKFGAETYAEPITTVAA